MLYRGDASIEGRPNVHRDFDLLFVLCRHPSDDDFVDQSADSFIVKRQFSREADVYISV